MIVQFDKPLCSQHNLPLIYVCSDINCNCSARLCLKCAQKHQNKIDVDDDFLKDNVLSKKIEI